MSQDIREKEDSAARSTDKASTVRLTLLGGFSARDSGGPARDLPTRKAKLIAAYLASPLGREHSRSAVAGLLWPDRGEEQARGSLRKELSALRAAFGSSAVIGGTTSAGLNPTVFTTDVQRLEEAAAGVSLGLEEAMSLSQPFLDGFDADDTALGDWLATERARCRGLAQTMLERSAEALAATDCARDAVAAARHLVSLDPLREQSHRLLMRLLAAQGEPSLALAQFMACKEILQSELGTGPSAETVRLADEISGGDAPAAETAELARPDKPSIAVLPFSNMSDDPDQGCIADGMSEDIITELSRFSDLFVTARNSSFAYRGDAVDIRKAARELGVRYVLEGSVRRRGKLRVTAQLIDSESGAHVWGERYDADLEEVFALQDEIIRNVVGAIAPQIEQAEVERSRRLRGDQLSAYETSMWAQALAYDGFRAADPAVLEQAMDKAEAALKLDPRNTHAMWILSTAYVYEHLYRWGDPEASLRTGSDFADRMIRVDPGNAKAYVTRALVHQYQGDFDAAVADHRRALELNPNYALNLFVMAWTEAAAGLPEEARDHAHLAMRLSPRDSDIWLGEGYAALGLANFIERRFDEARDWLRRAIQMHARMPIRQALSIAANGHLGDPQAARRHVEAVESFAPDFIADALAGRIKICKRDEDNALFVDGLRKGIANT